MKEFRAKSLLFIIIFALFVTISATALALCLTSPTTAYAQDGGFTKLFPSGNYIQSDNPTLVSANKSYMVIYDETKNKLFVRPNDSYDTTTISTTFSHVDDLFLLENVAFISADGKYYTVDVADANGAITERTLPTPSTITALNGDGTYLYAHSKTGYLSVYDKNLQIAFNADNLFDFDTLVGNMVVSGNGSVLNVFSIEYASSVYTVYDLNTSEKTIKEISSYISEAKVADVVYGLEVIPNGAEKSKRIIAMDKESGSTLFVTEISPTSFCAYANRLFTVEGNEVCVYALDDEHTSLSKIISYTMKGNDKLHFDMPTDVASFDGSYAVADSKNNRVALINSAGAMSTINFEKSPLKVCASNQDLYIAFDNEIRILSAISSDTQTSVYSLDSVIDVAYLDKLYALSTDGIYTIFGDSVVKITDVTGGKRIACAQDGTNVYVLTDTEILTINHNGFILPSIASGDFKLALDFAIDYEGNIYVAYANKVEIYKSTAVLTSPEATNGETQQGTTTTLVGYKHTLTSTIDVTSPYLEATLTSAYLDGSSLVFSAEECFIGTINVGATTKDGYTYTPVQTDIYDTYSFAKPLENALYYPIDGRAEYSYADSDVLLVLDSSKQNGESNFKYALNGDTLVKIDVTQFESVEPSAKSGYYSVKAESVLYVLPYEQNGAITLDDEAIVTLKSDCAQYDGNRWSLVEYRSNTYFVESELLEEYTEVIVEEEKTYGRINADRVGGVVNVYTSSSVESDVLTQIVDGTKVEVLQTLDDFYYISYDGIVGYVTKGELKLDGLTTVQIVAIVLSIIVALAGCAIFASIYLTKKNAEEKKENPQPEKRF